MRSLLILLALVSYVQSNEVLPNSNVHLRNERLFESQINISSECIKDVLNNGNGAIGLPSFDPLAMRNLTINLDTWLIEGLSGSISMTDFVAWDLAKWILTSIKNTPSFNPPVFHVETTTEWPYVQFRGLYNLNIHILGHDIHGSGRASLVINNFNVDVDQRVLLSSFIIEDLSIKMNMGSLECNIDQLLVDDFEITDLVNILAGRLAPWINENSDIIDKVLSTLVMAAWNNIGYNELDKFDLWAIIEELSKCLK